MGEWGPCDPVVDAPIYTPEHNLDGFKNKVTLVGVVPAVQDHYGRFVVLLEPLKAGAIGTAYAAGVCPVKVNIPDDEQDYQFADVSGGSTASLLATPLGAAFILWKEDDEATGEVWSVVLIVLPPSRPLALDPCDSADGDTRYVTHDLSKKLGKCCWSRTSATRCARRTRMRSHASSRAASRPRCEIWLAGASTRPSPHPSTVYFHLPGKPQYCTRACRRHAESTPGG